MKSVDAASAVTLVQSARRSATIAGFPLSAWAFALRIWVAMMAALYAAFWLQLESASSAAVTVGILALQTRGQAYQKAVYRVFATVIGVAASFVIAGLFPQTRELFIVGFAAWLGLCVYAGGLSDGNRAYGAVLAGYTVALVAVTQIDSPQNVFSAGVNRGAAIVVGIAALTLVSDFFAAAKCSRGSVRQAHGGPSARARLRARHPPWRECGPDPVSESAARDHRSSSRHHSARLGVRAMEKREARRPGTPPLRWSRKSAPRAHWHRSPRACHLFAKQLSRPSPVTSGRTRGISVSTAAPSTQGLPNVDPVYTWVRLAQRVPVRIRITDVPAGVQLVSGMTVTVTIRDAEAPESGGWLQRFAGFANRLSDIVRGPQPSPGCIPRIGDENGATVILPTPNPAAPLNPEELNPGLAPAMDTSPRAH